MKQITDYQNKKVIVLGLGKSGVNAARLLNKLGALVTVNDAQDFDNNPDAQELLSEGVRVITGGHPVSLLDEDFSLMVKNPGIPYSNVMVQRAQELGLPIITEPELAFQVSEAEWVGITGTNGKTTTTTLIGLMLNEGGVEAHVGGNIGIPLSQVAQEAGPGSKIVAELSSFQLLGIDTLRPHVAVLNNIYEAHLDYHGSRANYIAAKMRITMNQTANDYFVINWDKEEWRDLAQNVKAQVVPLSRTGVAGARAFVDADGWLCFDGERVVEADTIKIPGAHNVENALAAMTVAKLYGVGNAAIAHVLATFGGVKHRIQFLKELNGRRIYNDSKATNVEAASVAIEAFKAPEVLIAGGLDRHLSMDALIPLLKEHVHALVTYGETAAQMVEVAQKAGIADIKRVDNLDQAVPAAYALSNPGDVLLLSPAAASWDQFHTFEERGDRFIADVDKLQ